jgi:hypothetical protein
MYVLSITKTTADADGMIKFKPSVKSEFKSGALRASRSATLDGGAVIDNQGFSNGDRTFNVLADLGIADALKIWEWFTDAEFLQVATEDGVFYGLIDQCKLDHGQANFRFLVQE